MSDGTWRWLAWALAASTLAMASAANAQVTRVRGGDFRRHEVRDDTLLRQGRMEAGFSLAGSWATSHVTRADGTTDQQHSVYAIPSVVGGYMVLDWLEVRATLGLQYVGSGIGGDASQDHFSGVLTVQGLAQADFGLGVGGYLGLGLGGYYGWRNQPTEMAGVRYGFQHAGGVGQVLAGLLVQPGASLMFRGGLRLDLLYGAEWPSNDALGLEGSSAFNAHLMAELSIGWRFR
ncbi:MAG TPA: hypothetical protein RMH99_19740 [Sandaracinaceae bacterium LLY-WYZ-13_1]|nr:hypothetical protein [Sandaracinaceae bacterium LLY-WYZ-13_1]